MQTKKKKRSNLILGFLVLLLTIILIYRTTSYFKQVVVETSSAELKKGPGIEYKKIVSIKKKARLTIIRTKYHWSYVKTSDNRLGWVADWAINPQKIHKIDSLSDATIVLDPGHGGNDSGALSSAGKMEKKYTLIIAKKVARKLQEQGTKVYLTRQKDVYATLKSRSDLSNTVHADAFISFHFDSSPQENGASGFTTYYYHQRSSTGLAKTINKQLDNLTLSNRGIDFGDFYVLRNNEFPAVLLEMGYINSERDFEQISSQSYQNKVATDVVSGLEKYFSK
ncbi:N-acetylmuramoyl-L-alanine amidase [Liquorilactobacillus aquaticus DSM 21051]|uniref:N-acetylmuramoyl-L-alanine amidase n=1 Tax=Liquorilactobacillus aquaticus DSM 21051 TaxID=1423725 RepID=A0A0R2CWU9_9LACO|nr:N-acetylmuramoyl-L-alanine amidase [Liquorilactobacillus aquaticus]KRM96382.1 N-acetylmuramoyl-L-alanine amidase [Liquorilactobacillus aquaticus DSM 21051]